MEIAVIQNKLKLLFEKVVEPNYVMDSYYAENFFTKINSNDPDVLLLKSLPMIPDVICDAFDRADNCHVTCKVFLFRMLGVAVQNEVNFGKIYGRLGDRIARAFSETNLQGMNSSLLVAYMEVALALVNHNSGLYWLIEKDVWKHILVLCNEKKTVFVLRQTYKFASIFLWKLNDLGDEANLRQVITFIIKPVTDIDLLNCDSITSEEEENLCKTIEPMIQILLSVINNQDRIKKHTMVVDLLLKDFRIPSYCYLLYDRLRKENMSLLITKLLFWLTIGKIFITKPITPDVVYKREDFIELSVTYFNIIQYFIQRRCATLVFDFCIASNLIWGSVWGSEKPAIWELEGRRVDIQNQLLVISLVPSLVYVTMGKSSTSITNERVNDFIVKLMNSTCEHTARACYALRDLMFQLDILSVTLQSVKRLTCLKDHLNNEQANLVFQALFYVLKEYDPVDEQGELKSEEDYADNQEKVQVMTYVLDTLLSLVTNYNINWQESLEVLCLYSVVYNILNRPNLSCKFVVTALNVIAMTVKKFLPPNLSLLLESKPGSTMHELGKLIYMKMHDFNWEVRDSALELLLVCTEISYIKFPPFQKQIMSNNLINVAATMALNDHEYYVQVSALKCVGAASRTAAIWDQLKQQHPDILEQLLRILATNQEGIVRKEACSVLSYIYKNIKLSPGFKQSLYESMVAAALCDFHWEVQINALKFWREVMHSILNDQGMLDGTFPPVTFSRESRKIITLNEKEIQKILIKALEDLAAVGCLTVLVKLIHDETEVDIMDAALSLANELLEILFRYKVPESLKPRDTDPRTVDELFSTIKLQNFNSDNRTDDAQTSASADNVIESILNAGDLDLLSTIYERHMNLKNEGAATIVQSQPKLLKFATPYLFVTYLTSKDFKSVVEHKKNWKDGIKSISSLLDDVLGIYEVNDDVNSLDCY